MIYAYSISAIRTKELGITFSHVAGAVAASNGDTFMNCPHGQLRMGL